MTLLSKESSGEGEEKGMEEQRKRKADQRHKSGEKQKQKTKSMEKAKAWRKSSCQMGGGEADQTDQSIKRKQKAFINSLIILQ